MVSSANGRQLNNLLNILQFSRDDDFMRNMRGKVLVYYNNTREKKNDHTTGPETTDLSIFMREL